MNPEFWINKWNEGDIKFHQSKYHSQLEKYGDRFTPGVILVPLCGKSLDMLYLSSMGQKVVGVELSTIACRDFFIENGLKYTEKKLHDFIVFDSEEVVLWCGDFFKLPQLVWDQVTGIYDRAALVALPNDIRQKYAEEFSKRTKQHLEILLISFEYPQATLQGPPFSVSEEEVGQLFENFSLQKLHTLNSEVRGVEVFEKTYWLQGSDK